MSHVQKKKKFIQECSEKKKKKFRAAVFTITLNWKQPKY